jgi:hypothetical protein
VGGAGVIKLRRFYTPEKIAEIYGARYNPHRWPEHTLRIQRTIEIAQGLIDLYGLETCADLSAGDNSIPDGLHGLRSLQTSDGSIEDDLELVVVPVDLFICTETIEHLEAPWTVLERIAEVARFVVVSTPLDEAPMIGNYEHYWSFTETDVRDMLLNAGFVDLAVEHLHQAFWTYTYQIWTGRSTCTRSVS